MLKSIAMTNQPRLRFAGVGVFSFISYPTACSPKGYGSGLPLPSRTAAHSSAFKPDLSPTTCES